MLMGQTVKKFQLGLSVNTFEDPYFPTVSLNEYKTKLYGIGITGSYFINENIAFRLQTIFSKPYGESHSVESNAGFTGKTTYRFDQSALKIMPGVRWGVSQKNMSFFGGMGVPLTFMGDLTSDRVYRISQDGGPQTYEALEKITSPGTFSVGSGFFAGTDYRVSKSLHIGFEIGMGYVYSVNKGEVKTINKTTDSNGTINSEQSYKRNISSFGFTNIAGSIFIAYDIAR